MGTCSYVLTGTQKGMEQTFGSTCHGAGRAASRAKSRYVQTLRSLCRQSQRCCPCGCVCVCVCVCVRSRVLLVCSRTLKYEDVLTRLKEKKICIRVASPKLVMEEAPESYKDVTQVVDTCTHMTRRVLERGK